MKKMKETITEWSVLLVFCSAITFGLAIGKPIVELTSAITQMKTELKTEIPALRKALEDATLANKDANDKLWEHVNRYTPQIIENEKQIYNLHTRIANIEKISGK